MIEGFAIGHHTADSPGWLTGTTVILSTDGPADPGAVGGVAVRGGGPGTRETDLLDPTAMVDRVNAVVLTGGSAYGLAAADGVMAALEADGHGWPVGSDAVVPIVPAAVIFDLGRGGDAAHRPDAGFGRRAVAAATDGDPARGCVGAGAGAVCGGLKGGFGFAERAVGELSVAAAVVVNAVGSAVDPLSGRLLGDRADKLSAPTEGECRALSEAAARHGSSLNTTIGVVLTDAVLTKAQATRVASIAHDGMARSISPLHLMVDGDAVFCLASNRRPLDPRFGGLLAFNALLVAAAEVFADACVDAMLSADSRGHWPSYRDLAPSVRSR
jgi:L-aminopeptidase/D-esterase-like protein